MSATCEIWRAETVAQGLPSDPFVVLRAGCAAFPKLGVRQQGDPRLCGGAAALEAPACWRDGKVVEVSAEELRAQRIVRNS